MLKNFLRPLRQATHHLSTRTRTRTFASQTKTPIVKPTVKKIIQKQTEYKQLPDDSQYIEKFYSELKAFQREIRENDDIPFINFTDFQKDPNALIYYLEKFIQTKVYNDFSSDTMDGILVIKRYNEFLNNVKITLVLNGGHTHIFDILLQNKKLFDSFDLLKRQVERDRKRKQEQMNKDHPNSKSEE